MEGIRSEDYLSQDLRNLKLITVTTYQSLHSAMTKYQGMLVEEDGNQEEVDYHEYNLFHAITEANIGTLCLDECHHLRSEWWKALEEFKQHSLIQSTIALTATPPYDSSIAMWNRYINMCGEIDEEITVPELVKEGSLCPHQDYIYFNEPTKKEKAELSEFRKVGQNLVGEYSNDSQFISVIQSHKCLHENVELDQLLENPQYLSSILIFLNDLGLSYPKKYQKILGFKSLEKMSVKWLEVLLQGVLYDDVNSYDISDNYRESIIKNLKSKGVIEKNQVRMQMNKAVESMLVKSVGKCDSIKEIVFHEYQCLHKNLKLLILTDYIRKEYEKALGNPEMSAYNLGVLPFFEMLRRENEERKKDIKIAVLCGSMVIIPAQSKHKLLEIVGLSGSISFEKAGSLNENDYVKVKIQGDQHFITSAISDLFAQDDIQVLIGTKSLLGEGWDSPCVNTLILASFVGSFMLSNQMRGRAIRTYSADPLKASHVWHLVCVESNNKTNDGSNISASRYETSQDYQTLKRRMEHFLGLHYEEDVIENGLERLSDISETRSIKSMNKSMLKRSSNRSLLKERWDKSLTSYDQIEVVDEVEVKDKFITAIVFHDAIRQAIIFSICIALSFLIAWPFASKEHPVVYAVIAILVSLYLFIGSLFLKKIFTFKNPLGRLKAFGDGVYRALAMMNLLESPYSIVKTDMVAMVHSIYLSGGTAHDKVLFAKCIYEFFEGVDNQRYILYNPKRKKKTDAYFVVPEIFSKRKEDAYLFARYIEPFTGKYEVIYTRNEQGRKILLEARIHALANKEERCISRKKVKSPLE